MTGELIQRMARAIEDALAEEISKAVLNGDGEDGPYPSDYEHAARKALGAMREPTQAMEHAVDKLADESVAQFDIGPDVICITMIDAALKDA